MTTLREVAQQALEALKSCSGVPHWPALQPTIGALRAALAQQEEAKGGGRLPPPLQAEPVAFDWPRKACPCRDVQNGECLKLGCKWERDPSLVPEALRRQAGTQQAEPVQEPVAWQWLDTAHFRKKIPANATPSHWRPLYTAPPQRKPLTEQEIWDAVQHGVVGGVGMPSKAIAVARAVERAHGIGGEG